MPRVNKTKFAILGLLKMEPMSGYDIKKNTDSSIGFFWQENYGHIYPVLRNMEKEGLVVSEQIEKESGPTRILYSITAKGEDSFAEWMMEPTKTMKFREEFLLKLFFSTPDKAEKVKKMLEYEIHQQEQLLFEYEVVERHLKNKEAGNPYWYMTLRRGILYTQTQIAWCRECLDQL